jgi:hypothetical protein
MKRKSTRPPEISASDARGVIEDGILAREALALAGRTGQPAPQIYLRLHARRDQWQAINAEFPPPIGADGTPDYRANVQRFCDQYGEEPGAMLDTLANLAAQSHA